MTDSVITAEEFKSWLPTRRAHALVDKHFGNQTGEMDNIPGRLKGGLVMAAAINSTWEVDNQVVRTTALAVSRRHGAGRTSSASPVGDWARRSGRGPCGFSQGERNRPVTGTRWPSTESQRRHSQPLDLALGLPTA